MTDFFQKSRGTLVKLKGIFAAKIFEDFGFIVKCSLAHCSVADRPSTGVLKNTLQSFLLFKIFSE